MQRTTGSVDPRATLNCAVYIYKSRHAQAKAISVCVSVRIRGAKQEEPQARSKKSKDERFSQCSSDWSKPWNRIGVREAIH